MKVKFVRYEEQYKDDVIKLINKSFDNHNITDILEAFNVIGLVGLFAGRVVSYLNITFCVDVIKNTKYAMINYVCVDEAYRGNNIGKDMMMEAITICKSNGCSVIKLTSSSNREVANKMYQSLGFGIRETNVYEKVI